MILQQFTITMNKDKIHIRQLFACQIREDERQLIISHQLTPMPRGIYDTITIRV